VRIFLKIIALFMVLMLSGCKRVDNGMEQHLIDAIDLYSERMVSYAEVTNGKSDKLFNRLLLLERLSLGMSRVFDMRAYPFAQRGIPIVTADFVSMDDNLGFGAPLLPARPLDASHLDLIEEKAAELSSFNCDFDQVARKSADILYWIDAFEAEHTVYLALFRHMVESIGMSALHAIDYSVQSGGETEKLSCDLVKFQIATIKTPQLIWLEREANTLHQVGVGILVNDLPHIPFLAEYEASAHAVVIHP
jgi:hypothetical protein